MRCPACAGEIRDAARFCPACGSSLAAPADDAHPAPAAGPPSPNGPSPQLPGGPFVFLSYTRADSERALRLADLLQQAGVPVWIDLEDIPGGARWAATISAAIARCSAFLLLCSAAAFASHNVRQEIQLAWKDRRPYVPLFLERGTVPRDVEYFLEGWQWVEALDLPETEWLPRLLRALMRLGLPSEEDREAAPQAPAAPLPAPAAATNLPVPISSFIGRRREIEAIRLQLERNRLVTLAGSAGSGKSRLAVEVGRDVRGRFADGVWLVELAAIQQPALVLQAVASVLGVRESAGRSLVEALAEYLRGRQLLLILDNCEHLIGACAGLSERLVQACPALTLLLTSREVLNIGGEAVYRVRPLSLPDGDAESAAEIARSEAVQLFLARTAAARPSFTMTDENAAVVSAVVAHLDGIPLALELAAARMKVLSVEQIAEHLADRFRLLAGGNRTAPARQQTLHAAIDWSYQLLNEPEKVFFARLSVFAGSLDYDAAVAVCVQDGSDGVDVSTVLDLLAELVDKSLVLADEDAGGCLRYRLLESLREYGEEQLSERVEVNGSALSGDAEADDQRRYRLATSIRQYGESRLTEREPAEETRRRHWQYYLALAEEASPALLGPDQASWQARLAREHDNCRAALGWSIERREAIAALRLATALGRFWERHGYLSEGRAWLQRAMAQAEALPAELRARGLEYDGRLARLQADYSGARPLLEQSLALYRELNDRHSAAIVLGYLGVVALRQGEFDRARPLQEEALALLRELGDQRGVGTALLNLSNIVRRQGDGAGAVALRRESLEHYRATGDKQGMALALQNLGVSTTDAGDWARAVALLDESLALARELGDGYTTTRSLYDLVTPLLQLGDSARAAAVAKEALATCRARADRDGIAYCLEGLAAVAAKVGEAERAARLLGAAAALRESIRAPLAAVDRPAYDRATAAVQHALGAEAFAAAFAAGRAADLAEIVRSALAITVEPAAEPEGAASSRTP